MKNKKKYITAIGVLILVAVLIYYYLNDPSDSHNIYPGCMFKMATGWDCAGCGAQRSVYHLLHLEFLKALQFNPLFVLLVPYFLILIFYTIKDFIYGTGYPESFWFSGKMALVFAGLIILYTIIRNLPYYPFTLLAPPE